MEEVQTTAAVETAAPVVEPVTQTAAAPAVEAKTEAVEKPEAKVDAPAEDDLSWFPKKYLRDGKPDYKALADAHQNALKRINLKPGVAPESVDDYEYTPAGIQLDPEDHSAFKEFAKEQSLSPAQYSAVMAKYEEAVLKNLETPEKAKAHLEEAWGKDFETHSTNAKLAYEMYVPSDIPIEAIGNNPYLLRVLANIGAELREDKTPTKPSVNGTGGTSKEEVTKLMREPDYWKNAKKQALVNEWFSKNG